MASKPYRHVQFHLADESTENPAEETEMVEAYGQKLNVAQLEHTNHLIVIDRLPHQTYCDRLEVLIASCTVQLLMPDTLD